MTAKKSSFRGTIKGMVGIFPSEREATESARKLTKIAAINKREGVGVHIEEGYSAQVTQGKSRKHEWIVSIRLKKRGRKT